MESRSYRTLACVTIVRENEEAGVLGMCATGLRLGYQVNSIPTCYQLRRMEVYINREFCAESKKLGMISDESFKTA